MQELDALFDEFESKKRHERESSEVKRADADSKREKSRKVLREIVLPVLNEIAVDIQAKNCKVEVNEMIEAGVFPCLEMVFSPPTRPYPPRPPKSTIRFQHTEIGSLEIAQEIKGERDCKRHGSLPVPEVSEAKIKESVIGFVESVLLANIRP